MKRYRLNGESLVLQAGAVLAGDALSATEPWGFLRFRTPPLPGGWASVDRLGGEPAEFRVWNVATAQGSLLELSGGRAWLRTEPGPLEIDVCFGPRPGSYPLFELALTPASPGRLVVEALRRAGGALSAGESLPGLLRRARAAVGGRGPAVAGPAACGPGPAGGDLFRAAAVPPPDPPTRWPRVSIVVPTRDRPELLGSCLEGLRARTEYPDPELVIVDDGTTDPDAAALIEAARREGATVVRRDEAFNFAALCNAGVEASTGDVVVLLNNDVVPLGREWLKTLVARVLQPGVSAAGPLLLYPDGSVQHAGVVVGANGAAGHPWRGAAADAGGPATASRRCSAVTGACLAVRRVDWIRVGGMDADAFPITFNDVDLCLRLQAAGGAVVFEADARLEHAESRSRPPDADPSQRERRAAEAARFRALWCRTPRPDPWWPDALRPDESGDRRALADCPLPEARARDPRFEGAGHT